MTMFTEEQARAICAKAVSMSKADDCTAQLSGSVTGNIRFARNGVSTSGIVDTADLAVEVAFGKRSGVATINQFDDASLERVVRRAEELARLAPENPEYMPPIGKQAYRASDTFSPATAAITPDYRAQVAAASITPCKAGKLVAAGYLEDGQSFVAFANNKGNSGYQRSTGLDYTCTVRTEDGRGSGWVGHNVQDASSFDAGTDIRTAMRKASASVDAKAIEPGKYTVILEPAAAAGLISFMMNFFDARSADEGRSFLSKKGGGNKIGEQVFGPQVDIATDPWAPGAAVLPWDNGSYLPRQKMPIITGGKVQNLEYSRYWAQKQGKQPVAGPGNLLMAGGTKSTAELVRTTERGILVSRTWYIRMVDPQTVLLTGLTRDGTFYIENGEIKYPIKNLRFNESPVIMLNNIDELGKPVRVAGDESSLVMVLPPMRLRDFTFTSLSDAV
ncbi:TldD/PmbA family protein [Sphingomonas sanguinis]|jgi:predicted Zn-dependent protease|uniref:TldD/PmbA family protein n=1 Tax=Sphingomonas sanguinis TaxID=33051 RepID=A0A7Y7QZ97_9SPHN|nr:TldD/PmbA family protein [Sphingomonas sanguinis]MBZ6384077.1 TldD/PmbA family protein [Sphingomonas sanguinis]NNG50473.1 TldD/PmbA family protein [Sphingomonas sanguinis]NNG55012.1 TldD/PmbA family protein [Sphingomonas sanguinis]NVP33368.1 TldD/PmbA family protein [Sphingomonas sanguinis]